MDHQNIKDSSAIRKMIAAVLAKMENRFVYYGNENGEVVEKNVPFFYSITTSSQRYVDKTYLRDPSIGEDAVNTLASLPMPRGVLITDSIEIDNSARTNPFVRGNYRKYIDGNIEMVSSELRFVPINMPIKLSVSTTNITQLMNIFESMAKTPDASEPFYYYVNGIQVGGLITFAENLSKDISSEWNYTTDRTLVHEMNIDISSAIVNFDDFSTRHLRNRMKEVNLEINNPRRGRLGSPGLKIHGPDSPFGN